MIVETLSLIAAFCYTLSGILVVFGMRDSNPAAATFISMFANVAFLWPLTLAFSQVIFNSRAILLYAISAAFAPVAGRLLNYESLRRVGVSTTTSMLGLQPIIVAFLASIFLSEYFPVIIYLSILITVFGVLIIGRSSPASNEKKSFNKWELILPLSSTFCYSSSNIARKEGLRVQGLPLLASAFTCTFSMVYMFLLLVFTRKIRQLVVKRPSSAFFVLSGLVNSLAWITSFQALNVGEASIVSTILGTQPLIAVVLSYLLLRKTEVLTLNKIVGAALIVFGVTLISIFR